MSEYIFVTNIFEYSNIRIYSSHSGVEALIGVLESGVVSGGTLDAPKTIGGERWQALARGFKDFPHSEAFKVIRDCSFCLVSTASGALVVGGVRDRWIPSIHPPEIAFQ